MSERLLAWFGVFGAPFAWVVQFLIGLSLTFARCNLPGMPRSVAINGVAIAATAVAGVVAAAGGLAAVLAFRATRENEDDDAPPAGRVHFLAVVGMTTTPLFLFIIVLNGLGVVSLPGCVQA